MLLSGKLRLICAFVGLRELWNMLMCWKVSKQCGSLDSSISNAPTRALQNFDGTQRKI